MQKISIEITRGIVFLLSSIYTNCQFSRKCCICFALCSWVHSQLEQEAKNKHTNKQQMTEIRVTILKRISFTENYWNIYCDIAFSCFFHKCNCIHIPLVLHQTRMENLQTEISGLHSLKFMSFDNLFTRLRLMFSNQKSWKKYRVWNILFDLQTIDFFWNHAWKKWTPARCRPIKWSKIGIWEKRLTFSKAIDDLLCNIIH